MQSVEQKMPSHLLSLVLAFFLVDSFGEVLITFSQAVFLQDLNRNEEHMIQWNRT